jgi:hypothetical protein
MSIKLLKHIRMFNRLTFANNCYYVCGCIRNIAQKEVFGQKGISLRKHCFKRDNTLAVTVTVSKF